MIIRYWLGLGFAAALCAAPALGQDAQPKYTADELVAMLSHTAGPTFKADELARILAPVRTRGLTARAASDPGTPGSGVVPDLKVQFGFNSSELSPSARAQLDELGRAMQMDALRPLRFQIGGYTDAAGSEQYNAWLSQQRAGAVVAYLADRQGVGADRLKPIGFGEHDFADPRNPNSGVNRRVEVRTVQ